MMLTDELQHLRERDNGLAHGICFNHPFSVGFPIIHHTRNATHDPQKALSPPGFATRPGLLVS